MTEWSKGKLPSIEVHQSKSRARFNSDLEPSCELPWNVSLYVLKQLLPQNKGKRRPLT